MKKYILSIVLVFLGGLVFGQQDPQYSQYMFNGLVLNPAHAGNLDHFTATLIAREQWVGIAGRPRTQSLALDAPTRNMRHGFGLVVVNDIAGEWRDTRVTGSYAYRIQLNSNVRLSFGLQGSVNNIATNFSGLRADDVTDEAMTANSVNTWSPNFGAGLYLNSNSFFAGISAPEIMSQGLSAADPYLMEQDRVYFGTMGFILRKNKKVKLKPSVLVKYVENLPVQADLNLMVYFLDRFNVGVSYRTEDALVGIAEVRLNKQWRFGYAYDLNLSELRTLTSGSHELMIGFDLQYAKEAPVNPRLFR